MSFTEKDYQTAANKLGVPIAAVKAVAEVESNGVTNWPGGRPPILFEAQWFSKLTDHQFDDSHPGISSPTWNRALYKGGQAEYGRLEEAKALDEQAALQSASWGAFQVMGYHWEDLGYPNVEAFVEACQTAPGQLDAFIRYIQHNGLADAIRRQDWRAFAEGYNGSGAVDEYAPKIGAAYARFNGGPRDLRRGDQGDDVKALQSALGTVMDGDFGPDTAAAVRRVQRIHDLVDDGVVGSATRAALDL
jgi:murein L,D-transpeptidase YcbB/YkuD